jgi:hypothetical protein
MWLTLVSPACGYPRLNLYRHGCFARVVHNGIHPVDHRFLHPGLYVCRLLCITLNHHLVVTHENRYGPWTLVPALPQQS